MEDFIDNDEFNPDVADRFEKEKKEAQSQANHLVAAHVRRAQQAYKRVFVTGNATSDDVDFLMRDLAWFCSAHDPQWHSDPREQDRRVARREVFQRIMEYASLDHDTLMKRYVETQN